MYFSSPLQFFGWVDKVVSKTKKQKSRVIRSAKVSIQPSLRFCLAILESQVLIHRGLFFQKNLLRSLGGR